VLDGAISHLSDFIDRAGSVGVLVIESDEARSDEVSALLSSCQVEVKGREGTPRRAAPGDEVWSLRLRLHRARRPRRWTHDGAGGQSPMRRPRSDHVPRDRLRRRLAG